MQLNESHEFKALHKYESLTPHNDSHTQQDFILPQINVHNQHRLPIRMNPSYRLKYTNPIRVQYLRFLDRRSLDEKLNESFYLEKFAKINNFSYKESHKYETRRRQPQKKAKPQIQQEVYKKPAMKYFNPDDSEVLPEDVELILNKKTSKVVSNSKVFISE